MRFRRPSYVGLDPYPLDPPGRRLLVLVGFFVTFSLVSNVTASKIVDFHITYASAAVVFYPPTFFLADTIAEVWGKPVARRIIWLGLAANFTASLMYLLAVAFPPAPFYADQEAYAAVLGSAPRIAVASMTAYTVSQLLDVNLFLYIRSLTRGRHLWLRNNVAVLVSQLVDTTLFSFVAFLGRAPVSAIWEIIATEYTIKVLLTLLGTPITYLLVGWARGVLLNFSRKLPKQENGNT
ncbi:MAG: putative preQ0 transporter [Brockia lithotrophica]|uniref:Probable queuosine precursor transporter n=1 Tax=Brockia lithotrophica TaxID=933949 RepID=A0A2T5G959_9BACL|nr:MAG: putative preQ0 transporter [Brockia lithotrophica]